MTLKNVRIHLIALLLLIGAASFALAQDEADPTLIELGDQTITETQFDNRFALAARSIAARQGLPYNEETQALFDSLRPAYLEQLATELVLLNEAETRGVTVGDDEVEAQLAQARQSMGSDEVFNQFLTETGFQDEAAFREFLRDSLTVQKVVDELRQGTEVTDEEVQTFYDENQEQIGQPLEQVRDQVREQLVRNRVNQQIAELRQASDIQVFADNLSASAQANPGTTAQAPSGQTTEAPTTPEAAAQNLQNLLTQGIDTVPTPEVVTAFQNLRTNIQDDSELQVVAVAIEPVESALTAEPFDQAALVEALQNLALAMRTAADAGDATLTVELASLVDQTAAFIQNEGFTPRMEVETP